MHTQCGESYRLRAVDGRMLVISKESTVLETWMHYDALIYVQDVFR